LEEAGVDRSGDAGALTFEQSSRDAAGEQVRRAPAGERHADEHRTVAQRLLLVHRTEARLDEQLVAWTLGVGVFDRVGGDRGDDEVGVPRREVADAARPTGSLARSPVVDEHVGTRQQLVEPGLVLGRVHIEGDRLLAAVPGGEPRRLLPARRITGHGFDLEHRRAELGEPARRRRTRQPDRRVDHHDLGEHADRSLSHCAVPFATSPAGVLRCAPSDLVPIF
jgi:hypothetical protein